MLSVQFIKSQNHLINEPLIASRLVNQQVMSYDAFCDYLAQGSTVTAADVSAVMKQIEKWLPTILALNTKVICSPEGLTFRPTVRGSLTQSQLKAKLQAKLTADPTAEIDVNRDITVSDLTIADLSACIVIDLPKKWDIAFQQMVEFKRVTKTATEVNEPTTTPEENTGTTTPDDSGEGDGGF